MLAPRGTHEGRHHPPSLSFKLLNVYLATSDNHHRRRAKQLKLLAGIPNDMHLCLGSDFNFVEHAGDATNYVHALKHGVDTTWIRIITKHSLWEVHQPTHTNI